MKLLLRNILLLLTLATSASCVMRTRIERNVIRFGTKANVTKALINSDSNLQNATEGIGVYSRMTNVENGKKYYIYNNSQIRYDSARGGFWYSEDDQYWIDKTVYDFTLIYPYTTSGIGSGAASYVIADNTLTIDCGKTTASNAMSKAAPDLMIGRASRDLVNDPGNYSYVPVELQHMFACLEFKVINASDRTVLNAGYPRLSGILYKGAAGISEDDKITWDISPDKVTGEQYYDGKYTLQNIPVSSSNAQNLFECEQLLVLPQQSYLPKIGNTSYDITFTFKYKDANNTEYTNEYKISENAAVRQWEAGKKYVYTATITSSYVVFSVEVRDWRNGGTYILK